MCPNCGRISNNHKCVNPFFAKNHSHLLVCNHICKSCGATDGPWDGKNLDDIYQFRVQFIDDGNYCSNAYDPSAMSKAEREIEQLEAELRECRRIIVDGNTEYALLWLTDEDR